MQIMNCKRVRRLHFVGIGGAGMSGIAEVVKENGFDVSGSDMGEGQVIDYLKNLGIEIASKHEAKNVENADLVVYSSAIPYDNAELVEARNRRIPIIRRAEMLGELMRLSIRLLLPVRMEKLQPHPLLGKFGKKRNLIRPLLWVVL